MWLWLKLATGAFHWHDWGGPGRGSAPEAPEHGCGTLCPVDGWVGRARHVPGGMILAAQESELSQYFQRHELDAITCFHLQNI